MFKEASPINYVDDISTPILLIHSEEDTSVSYIQAKKMYSRLERAKKEVQFHTLEKDDHYLNLKASRKDILSLIQPFFEKHLGQ